MLNKPSRSLACTVHPCPGESSSCFGVLPEALEDASALCSVPQTTRNELACSSDVARGLKQSTCQCLCEHASIELQLPPTLDECHRVQLAVADDEERWS